MIVSLMGTSESIRVWFPKRLPFVTPASRRLPPFAAFLLAMHAAKELQGSARR
ncbi:hypothetical protein WBP06_19220 [Novosphingobium sp. BL-8H]|uniref:hypothetical protein n=1 Tax=Novosphingobium sp. BL-8H TaxID=3127640 RepID=UPI00375649A5